MGRSATLKAEPDVAWALGPSGGGEWPGPLPVCFLQPASPGEGGSGVGPWLVVGRHFMALCLPQAQVPL